ncbi:collagen, type I, alpha 1b-like [Oryctolagus cuniculus]|uniref:collagen, type I, alpha 1b-like n=1 Tax=Oryctolagus cuniculus TaxID=9986 RepID=UPI003879A7DF
MPSAACPARPSRLPRSGFCGRPRGRDGTRRGGAAEASGGRRSGPAGRGGAGGAGPRRGAGPAAGGAGPRRPGARLAVAGAAHRRASTWALARLPAGGRRREGGRVRRRGLRWPPAWASREPGAYCPDGRGRAARRAPPALRAQSGRLAPGAARPGAGGVARWTPPPYHVPAGPRGRRQDPEPDRAPRREARRGAGRAGSRGGSRARPPPSARGFPALPPGLRLPHGAVGTRGRTCVRATRRARASGGAGPAPLRGGEGHTCPAAWASPHPWARGSGPRGPAAPTQRGARSRAAHAAGLPHGPLSRAAPGLTQRQRRRPPRFPHASAPVTRPGTSRPPGSSHEHAGRRAPGTALEQPHSPGETPALRTPQEQAGP